MCEVSFIVINSEWIYRLYKYENFLFENIRFCLDNVLI